MATPRKEVKRLTQQLSRELNWAMQTGGAAARRVRPALPPLPPPPSARPVQAEPRPEAPAPSPDLTPPPPDNASPTAAPPPDPEDAELFQPTPASAARRADAPKDRPWEAYAPAETSTGPEDQDGVLAGPKRGSHPDGGSARPDGAPAHRDGASASPDGGSAGPDGAPAYRDGASASPDGASTRPDGASAGPDGAPAHRDGASASPDGASARPDGAPALRDGGSAGPDGAPNYRDGAPAPGDGGSAGPDGAPAHPDGASGPDGAPTGPDGAPAYLDGDPAHPDGGLAGPDGAPAGAEEAGDGVWGEAVMPEGSPAQQLKWLARALRQELSWAVRVGAQPGPPPVTDAVLPVAGFAPATRAGAQGADPAWQAPEAAPMVSPGRSRAASQVRRAVANPNAPWESYLSDRAPAAPQAPAPSSSGDAAPARDPTDATAPRSPAPEPPSASAPRAPGLAPTPTVTSAPRSPGPDATSAGGHAPRSSAPASTSAGGHAPRSSAPASTGSAAPARDPAAAPDRRPSAGVGSPEGRGPGGHAPRSSAPASTGASARDVAPAARAPAPSSTGVSASGRDPASTRRPSAGVGSPEGRGPGDHAPRSPGSASSGAPARDPAAGPDRRPPAGGRPGWRWGSPEEPYPALMGALSCQPPGLEGVRQVLGDCRRCPLQAGRNQIVFGAGDPQAELMFVGEGPGADEDRQGQPFVGKAGAQLTAIIERGMGMRRSEVYIANVVKCRPPNNRDPEPAEVERCVPFLRAQVVRVRPKVIVALGLHASRVLLNSNASMGRLRGRWGWFEGIPVMPTFHPAFLLRQPEAKREVWTDIKAVLTRLGRTIPNQKRR